MSKFQTTRWIWAIIMIVGILVADQLTKLWAVETLAGEQTWQYFGDTFRLQYALNPGGFLGLGGSLSPEMRSALFIGLNGIGLLALATMPFIKRLSLPIFLACWLIFAGGVGNQIDRIRLGGYVIDFLNVGIGSLRSGIFNVADMAITLGAIILFCNALKPSTAAAPAKLEQPTESPAS